MAAVVCVGIVGFAGILLVYFLSKRKKRSKKKERLGGAVNPVSSGLGRLTPVKTDYYVYHM